MAPNLRTEHGTMRFGRDTRCIVIFFQDSLGGLGAYLPLTRQVVKPLKASWVRYKPLVREAIILRRQATRNNDLNNNICINIASLLTLKPKKHRHKKNKIDNAERQKKRVRAETLTLGILSYTITKLHQEVAFVPYHRTLLYAYPLTLPSPWKNPLPPKPSSLGVAQTSGVATSS
jgi:hypothetical protein